MAWTGLAVLAVSILAGCARGPDEAALRREVQEKLTRQVKDGLLEVASLGRKGSAPLPSGEQGTKRLVVYYNAVLRFRQDYDFGGWEKLSPASLGYALGATEKGVFGVKPQNRAGDVLYVYGTSTYEWSGGAWKSVAAAPAAVTAAPDRENTAPPSRSKQLIDTLAAMVDLPPPGVDPGQDEVIADELDRATENIQRRLARRRHVYTFASGPRGGEYARFGAAFVESMRRLRPEAAVRNVETEGSVQNAGLLARGEADYAIVQADVAAEAVAGRGPFGRGGPLTMLRALGSLFPEAVHVVVPAASPIRAVGDLRGKRVDIGAPGSGTRYSAVAVLAASGLGVRDLREASEGGREEAARRLAAGQLDAFFVTIAAPARDLQALAARAGMRLLPLASRSINRLVAENPGLIAMTLPANTYPGQGEPVATVATAALLVATTDVPDAEVEKVVGFVFARADLAAAGSAEGVKVSKDSALRGITIPMHPGASRFLGSRP
ncbi:MAG: TAXI family TRAP transporter solute-binding subunit [Candidatus Rokuibacteriota bacterium]